MNCDFSQVMLERKGGYIYRNKPAVLKVEKELMSYAKKANALFAKRFGFEPFILEYLEADYVGEKNGINEVYVQTRKDLWKDRKEIIDQGHDGNYAAYCTLNDYDKETGVMGESDIVFSPEYYVDARSELRKAKRNKRQQERESEEAAEYIEDREKEVREHFREQERQINQVQDPNYRKDLLADLDRRKREWEKRVKEAYRNKRNFDEHLDSYENKLNDYEDTIEYITLITMLHEMGHALGYKHILDEPKNIMYPKNIGGSRSLNAKQANAIVCAFQKLNGLTTRY